MVNNGKQRWSSVQKRIKKKLGLLLINYVVFFFAAYSFVPFCYFYFEDTQSKWNAHFFFLCKWKCKNILTQVHLYACTHVYRVCSAIVLHLHATNRLHGVLKIIVSAQFSLEKILCTFFGINLNSSTLIWWWAIHRWQTNGYEWYLENNKETLSFISHTLCFNIYAL